MMATILTLFIFYLVQYVLPSQCLFETSKFVKKDVCTDHFIQLDKPARKMLASICEPQCMIVCHEAEGCSISKCESSTNCILGRYVGINYFDDDDCTATEKMWVSYEAYQKQNTTSSNLSPSEVVEHMVYGEGKIASPVQIYDSTINVVPKLKYNVKVEVLRNDLAHPIEKVSKITFDGAVIGDCNPDGGDYDCTFFDCQDSIQNSPVSSDTGSILVALTYEGHSWHCDCDKETWECSRANEIAARISMTAVARITLTPIIGN